MLDTIVRGILFVGLLFALFGICVEWERIREGGEDD